MTIIEAIKKYKRIRRLVPRHLGSQGDGWLCSGYVLSLLIPYTNMYSSFYDIDYPITANDILADDWQGSQEKSLE